MVTIEALDAVAVVGAEVLKPAVLKGMVDVIALVVGTVMPVPVIIVDVRCAVDAAAVAVLRFGLGSSIIALGRGRWNASLISARVILSPLFTMLRESRQGNEEGQRHYINQR